MEVYDCAHQLARELGRSSAYNDLRLARAKMASNPANVDMLRDFRRRQLVVEMAVLNGKEPEEGEKRALEESYRIISLNPAITAYLEAEQRLAQLLADIQKILIEALPEWSTDIQGAIDKE